MNLPGGVLWLAFFLTLPWRKKVSYQKFQAKVNLCTRQLIVCRPVLLELRVREKVKWKAEGKEKGSSKSVVYQDLSKLKPPLFSRAIAPAIRYMISANIL